jgi:hypothetical protein
MRKQEIEKTADVICTDENFNKKENIDTDNECCSAAIDDILENKRASVFELTGWKLAVVLALLGMCAFVFLWFPEFAPDDPVLRLANGISTIFQYVMGFFVVWELLCALLCGGSHPEFAVSVVFWALITAIGEFACPYFLPNVFVTMCVQCAIVVINRYVFMLMMENRGDE